MKSARILALLCAAASTHGCGGDPPSTATGQSPSFAIAQLEERLERVAVAELQQSDEQPIVRLSGLDVDARGRLLLGDAGEANVKLFDPAGVLLWASGRKGQGPGEFTAPRYPRFGPDGRVHVADGSNQQITILDSSGRYVDRIDLFDVGSLSGFAVLADGSYLVSGRFGAGADVLAHLGSDGRVRRTFLPIRDVLPEGAEAGDAPWGNVRQAFMAVRNDTAFVVTTISDSLWTVDVASGVVTARSIRPPGYSAPSRPPKAPRTIGELREWAESFHIAATVHATENSIVVPFVRGILNYGDPMILAARAPSGELVAIEGAPPIVLGSSHDDVLFSIENPREESVVIGRYRWR